MKFSSVILSVLMAGELVAATSSAGQSRKKIVTFYSETDYQGLNYTLLDNRLHYCVNYTHGPLVVSSALLFHDTVCDLYTEQGCTVDSFVRTIYKDTPDTGRIDQFSMHCTTVPQAEGNWTELENGPALCWNPRIVNNRNK